MFVHQKVKYLLQDKNFVCVCIVYNDNSFVFFLQHVIKHYFQIGTPKNTNRFNKVLKKDKTFPKTAYTLPKYYFVIKEKKNVAF